MTERRKNHEKRNAIKVSTSAMGEAIRTGTRPLSAEVIYAACKHPIVTDGPRIPLLYGSAATLVCTRCGSYRRSGDERWLPKEQLEDDLKEE
jgi:hypothetical protein